MARPLRVLYEGAWYHVMNRGASRRAVFLNWADRADFLRQLDRANREHGLEIHAYCLMSNHFHLLVRTPEANLDRIMRQVDGIYTQRFHKRHGGDGPLFRGRYRSVLVQADDHLAQVSRYIHLNPVEAGLVGQPEQWLYSSTRAYFGLASPARWLSIGFVLDRFGSVRERYRAFVAQGVDATTRAFYRRPRPGPVFGDCAFVERVRRQVDPACAVPDPRAGDVTHLRHGSNPSLSELGEWVSRAFGVEFDSLRTRSRRAGEVRGLARGAMLLAARCLGGYRSHDVARFLGYTSTAAAAQAVLRYERAAGAKPALSRRVDRILSDARRGRAAVRNDVAMSNVKT